MAPINFENNIKDKLDKRTLKPSVDAWGKLSERLDNQEKKNNKKPYWWLGLAASIVGVLFIVSQFWNNETQVNDAPKIVVTPEVIQENETNPVVYENENLKGLEQVKIKPKKAIAEKNETQKLISTEKEPEFVVAVNDVKIVSKGKKNTLSTTESPKKSLTFEEQKIQEIIAQVQFMKEESKVITDTDIDALLKQAQKEIKLNRLYNETTGVVDANALLQDVEAELDQTFRSKVFEALKTSYNSVKTAVAQRND